MSRLLRAGVTTAIVDGLFSSVLSAFFYGSSVRRLFQGVAAVPLGQSTFDRGWTTACLGILIHICVAFAWSTVFYVLFERSAWIRRVTSSPAGLIGVAAIYGPIVWLTMSAVVIPIFTQRPPAIVFRWWVQFIGHGPFVGLPIVASIASGSRPRTG